jgi:hypothetical protein
MIKRYSTSLFLLTCAILCSATPYICSYFHPFYHVSATASLEQNGLSKISIVPDYDGMYLISVALRRQREPADLNCLLGYSFLNPTKCKNTPSIIDFMLTVNEDETVISNNNHIESFGFSFSQDETVVIIKHLKLSQKHHYNITLRSLKDASMLNFLNPTLVVEEDNNPVKGYGFWVTWSVFLALAGAWNMLCKLALYFYLHLKNNLNKLTKN